MNESKNIANDAKANLFKHIFNICEYCRSKGLKVSQAQKIDIYSSLPYLDLTRRDTLKITMRTQIAQSREQEATFNRLFETYWGDRVEDREGDLLTANAELLRTNLTSGRKNEGHRDMVSEPKVEGSENTKKDANLLARWDPFAPPLDQTISRIAKKLAFQKSRRNKVGVKGKQVDLRTSLKSNICFRGDLIKIYKKNKKLLKTKLILLYDVSGSMDVFNSFLLQLMFGIQKKIPTSRTFVFSTKTNEITGYLKENDIESSMIKLSNTVKHWSGGTDIYGAMQMMNDKVLNESMKKNTILIIVSDGYGSGHQKPSHSDILPLEREFQVCKRMVKKLIWINPMYGASTFQIRAAALKIAKPYLDLFLPAFNSKALEKLAEGLMEIK